MSELLSLMWGIIGFIFIAAGEDFMKVSICFLICISLVGILESKLYKKI